ncbi:VOC family protein [Ilumatobacter sp.]|uniref:VOC family protein n=1 Tax=Ilumatobacter sp. TaxID=1967498 RepID=UPI003B51E076
MTITTTTHLNFRGDARRALEFYRSVFGGELTAFTYEDARSVGDPADADRIMWGQVVSEAGFRIMAYDVPSDRPFERGDGSFFVSVRAGSADEITDLWNELSGGSEVVVDLAPAGWAPLYGMLKDEFGVVWVLDVTAPDSGS